MCSWKSELFFAIVKQDIETIEAILTKEDTSKDNICIYYAKDCHSCLKNLEYPINSDQQNVDNILNDLRPMIESGRCRCLTSSNATERTAVKQSVSILHLLCLYGPVHLVDQLLQSGHDPRQVTPDTFCTTLHCLAQNANSLSEDAVDLADKLLELGVDVNARDVRRNTALHLAIRSHNVQLAVRLIDRNSYLDARNERGETALLISARHSKEQVVAKLCQVGADPNIKDDNMMLPLNVAIYKYSDAMLNAILKNPRVNVNETGVGKAGYIATPPLLLATSCGYDEAVEQLLDRGATVDCLDKYDNSPLIIAACTNNLDTARLLLRHKADVNLSHPDGYSPLHFAAWEGHTDMCQLLIDAGASVDGTTDDGNTALALACHDNYIDTVELLLANDCDVNLMNQDRQAPIHYCSYNGNTDAVIRLLARGADPDVENSLNVTPIWNAVYADVPDLVQLFIRCNVRLGVASKGVNHRVEQPCFIYDEPRTPLYVACTRSETVAKLLVLAGVRLDRETWISDGDVPRELCFNRELYAWIRQQATRPQSLLRITRSVIRELLGVNPQKKVRVLQIPTEMKDFLTFKSFLHDL